MYQQFYHLRKEPFHVTPDPEFLFLSPSHKQALGSIIYGVKNKKGFIVITGEVGVGKTTIVRSYLEGVVRQKTNIIYVFNANVSFKNLLKTIYKELDLEIKTEELVEMLNDLYQVLMEEYKQGNTILLIIDEVQNMPIETLENLRMLSNLETSKNKLIQIVLVGQPEFEKILNLHELRQLKQRIAIHFAIFSFTVKESLAYIHHRLAKVAIYPDSPIFTRGALKKIVKEAKGIPRVINILCDNALMTGFRYKKKPIDTKIVEKVIADFRGREKTSFWKSYLPIWVFSSFMVLILMAVLLLFSPYKRIFYPKAEPTALSRDVTISPPKEEMKSSDVPLPSTQEKTDPLKEEEILEPVKK